MSDEHKHWDTVRCDTCAWWHACDQSGIEAGEDEDYMMGECRQRSPAIVPLSPPNYWGRWPKVQAGQWCGKWSPIPGFIKQ